MKYGVLLVCARTVNEQAADFVIVRKFDEMSIRNEMDCPLLVLTSDLFVTSPTKIIRPISIVHECNDTCTINEEPDSARLTFEHNFSNNIFCYNIFCIGNKKIFINDS